jgi:hypothetical protein
MVVTNESVPEHVGMRPGDRHAGLPRELPKAAGGRAPVHPGTAAVEQDGAAHPARNGAVDGPAERGRQRDQDDLAALAAHAKDPVTVLLAQVADVGAGGLEDPQAQQPEHGDQRKVIPVRGLARGGQQGLELQVGEPERRRLRRHRRAADMLGRGML